MPPFWLLGLWYLLPSPETCLSPSERSTQMTSCGLQLVFVCVYATQLPELTVPSSALVGHTTGVVVAEQVKGTKEDFVCNRRGVCGRYPPCSLPWPTQFSLLLYCAPPVATQSPVVCVTEARRPLNAFATYLHQSQGRRPDGSLHISHFNPFGSPCRPQHRQLQLRGASWLQRRTRGIRSHR